MAIMRIALAAASLYYIAPHITNNLVSDAINSTRQVSIDTKHPDSMTVAALEFCRKNTQACLKFAETTLVGNNIHSSDKVKITTIQIPINAALRTTLPDNPPLPPLKTLMPQNLKQGAAKRT